MPDPKRRTLLKALACSTAGALSPWCAWTHAASARAKSGSLSKTIPASGEPINVIGMGTWQTFNVGGDSVLRDQRTQVLGEFFERGGQLVDSSPMYGSSQEVLGYALARLNHPKALFAADKIWTGDAGQTLEQMQSSLRAWQLQRFELLQVHNLLSWRAHLPKLFELKRAGQLRHVGITTSHGRRHGELAEVMRAEPLDFVQLTYNMANLEAAERLLPLAAEKGIAVIVNRPFGGGSLIRRLQSADHPLPPWCAEWGIGNWPQFLLKYVVSHPAVTCAIPATTQVEHMRENMGAAQGPLPDAATRQRMLSHFQSL